VASRPVHVLTFVHLTATHVTGITLSVVMFITCDIVARSSVPLYYGMNRLYDLTAVY